VELLSVVDDHLTHLGFVGVPGPVSGDLPVNLCVYPYPHGNAPDAEHELERLVIPRQVITQLMIGEQAAVVGEPTGAGSPNLSLDTSPR
jgi:hypothetical protein